LVASLALTRQHSEVAKHEGQEEKLIPAAEKEHKLTAEEKKREFSALARFWPVTLRSILAGMLIGGAVAG
jgi:hypothetical protein